MAQYLWLLLVAFASPSAQGLRLAATSPQVTELVFDLGKGGDLVAVSAFSQYPQAAKSLPSLGALFHPSIERALAVGTEAIALDRMNESSTFRQAAAALGIRSYEFSMTSVESLVTDSRRFLKEAYGEVRHRQLDRVMPCVSAYHPTRRFRFLALTWFQPPIAFGATTFISDVLTRVGGDNVITAKTQTQFPRLSVEWLVAREVDFVFYLTEFPDSIKEAQLAISSWWPKKTPPLVVLDVDDFARAGFTPLRRADSLPMVQPKTGWKECIEALR